MLAGTACECLHVYLLEWTCATHGRVSLSDYTFNLTHYESSFKCGIRQKKRVISLLKENPDLGGRSGICSIAPLLIYYLLHEIIPVKFYILQINHSQVIPWLSAPLRSFSDQ
jgi:hypothetical protein